VARYLRRCTLRYAMGTRAKTKSTKMTQKLKQPDFATQPTLTTMIMVVCAGARSFLRVVICLSIISTPPARVAQSTVSSQA
jgi:hypothetical protein